MRLRLLSWMLRALSLRSDPETAPRLREFAAELAALDSPSPAERADATGR